jgi:2,4-dienoyl-CoA reductase-like NADH-dependent reductase (Old Yellow Enzyme family)
MIADARRATLLPARGMTIPTTLSRRPDKRLLRLLPVERWPSAEEVLASRWMSPIELGPVRALERTWVPAMVPWRATPDGFVTPAVIDWYRRFAEGAPGVIVVEATGIRDVPSGPLLRVSHDRFVPGLRALVEAVREASRGRTRLFLQIIDFLAIKRRPERDTFLQRFLVIDDALRARLPSAIADRDEPAIRAHLCAEDDAALAAVLSPRDLESMTMGYRERVTDVHLPHVRDLPRALPPLFAAAARRAEEAGFDGVELHYAHAYTMASFLSKKNDRADGYGGAREHRVRLPLEVYGAVRAAVGRRFTVGCRYLGDEVIEGGSRIDDATFFGVELARAGMDFLSISKGGRFEDAEQPKVGHAAYPYTGPSGHECMPTVHIDPPGPFGRNVWLSAAIRGAIRGAGLATPVITAGGIATFEQAETILERGEADAVAMARQALADPDFFEKLRRGRGDEIRRCLFTNYCEALDQAHKEVTCQRWDREYLPDEDRASVATSADGKRRLVAPRWASGQRAPEQEASEQTRRE